MRAREAGCECRQEQQACGRSSERSASVSLSQAGNSLGAAKAQSDNVDLSVSREPPDSRRRSSHDGTKRGVPLARTMSQLDHTQMKTAGDRANSPILLAGQMAAQYEHVEPMLLRASKKGCLDEGGELRRHFECPEPG